MKIVLILSKPLDCKLPVTNFCCRIYWQLSNQRFKAGRNLIKGKKLNKKKGEDKRIMVFRRDYRRHRAGYIINKKKGFLQRFFSNLSVVGWLVFINVVVSIIGFISWGINPETINWFALKPESILQGKYLWTLVLHMFVHGGIFHLLINMFVLVSLGGLCERIIGRKRFLWFYLSAGIFAGIFSVLIAEAFGNGNLGARVFGSPDVYMVGASGAIFAIAGLFVMLLPRIRFMIIFLPFFSLPAYIMVPFVLFFTWIASVSAGLPIGNVAHFGGFLAGIAYGYFLRVKYKRKVKMLQRQFR